MAKKEEKKWSEPVTLEALGITQEEAETAINVACDLSIPASTIKGSAAEDTLKKMMNASGPIIINISKKE